jgi:hypothetical protein
MYICAMNIHVFISRRLKINHESHEFIIDSGTDANSSYQRRKADFSCVLFAMKYFTKADTLVPNVKQQEKNTYLGKQFRKKSRQNTEILVRYHCGGWSEEVN